MPYKYNPFTDEFDYYQTGSSNPFIINGTNGITYLRMESPIDGSLWDAYLDENGEWVTVPVGVSAGSDIFGLLALRNLA